MLFRLTYDLKKEEKKDIKSSFQGAHHFVILVAQQRGGTGLDFPKIKVEF